jgi:hypothetical protein
MKEISRGIDILFVRGGIVALLNVGERSYRQQIVGRKFITERAKEFSMAVSIQNTIIFGAAFGVVFALAGTFLHRRMEKRN